MDDPDRLGDMLSTDHEPTRKEVLDRAAAQLAELDRLRAEYAAMTPEERAALPESVRRFWEG